MIIVKLLGGLGNQMFQYAIGKKLAIINNTDLFFDLSSYKKDKLRKYELSNLNITGKIVPVYILIKVKIIKLVKKLVPFYSNKIMIIIYKEKEKFKYDAEIFKIKDNLYLEGSWQSEKYFKDIKDIIKNEFIVKDNPDKENIKKIELIKNSNSICVHIRKSDYYKNDFMRNIFGVCSKEYYAKALNIIYQKVNNPSFFIFSDDIAWVRKNLKIKGEIYYMDHNNNDRSWEDLKLMMNCKNFIIANSTFSWWGAWLSKYEEKIVIAPKKWLNNTNYNFDDLFPKEWILV